MATPTKHAKRCTPSSAYRWSVCTASPTFEDNFPSDTSVYAEEGTLAHSVCELYARKKFKVMSTRKFNSELKKLRENELFAEEMIHTAEAYVQYLTEKAMTYQSTPHVTFELRVDISSYVPECFGTCDCVMIGGDTLHITDYKHGKGVYVSAIDNIQMRLYALGALNMFGPIFGDQIKYVSTGICQPRHHENVEEDKLTVEELRAWGEALKPIAQTAFTGEGATFVPGEHCRFCKGRAQCRARAEQNTALEDFKGCIPAGKYPPVVADLDAVQKTVLGLPPMLSDTEIGDLLERGKNLVQWFNDLQTYATEALLAGREVPGWKIVEGRSIRAFADTDAAMRTLVDAGYNEAIIYERKPKTLSELEKMLGKKTFGDLLGGCVTKPRGKPTLAPTSDRREPYRPAVADFAGVQQNE